MSRRVVITGIGLVSSLGIGTSANWGALLAGTSGVARITKFDPTDYPAQIAAEVSGFDPLQFVEKKDVKKMDVFIQYAIAASQFAMDDSRLPITAESAPRTGVFIASGIGGFSTIEREHRALLAAYQLSLGVQLVAHLHPGAAIAVGEDPSHDGRVGGSHDNEIAGLPTVVRDDPARRVGDDCRRGKGKQGEQHGVGG